MEHRQLQVTSQVHQWAVSAVSGTAKAGHKYLKDVDVPDLANGEALVDGLLVSEPLPILQDKRKTWSQLWRRDLAEAPHVRQASQQLKQAVGDAEPH